MLNPILRKNDVLFSGTETDGERSFHIRLNMEPSKYKYDFYNMCTLPEQFVEQALLLGFMVEPHWIKDRAERGEKALVGGRYENYYAPQSPHILAFFSGNASMTNKNLANHLLRKE